MLPLIPRISTSCPAGTLPLQWKASLPAGPNQAAKTVSTTNVVENMAISLLNQQTVSGSWLLVTGSRTRVVEDATRNQQPETRNGFIHISMPASDLPASLFAPGNSWLLALPRTTAVVPR